MSYESNSPSVSDDPSILRIAPRVDADGRTRRVQDAGAINAHPVRLDAARSQSPRWKCSPSLYHLTWSGRMVSHFFVETRLAAQHAACRLHLRMCQHIDVSLHYSITFISSFPSVPDHHSQGIGLTLASTPRNSPRWTRDACTSRTAATCTCNK